MEGEFLLDTKIYTSQRDINFHFSPFVIRPFIYIFASLNTIHKSYATPHSHPHHPLAACAKA